VVIVGGRESAPEERRKLRETEIKTVVAGVYYVHVAGVITLRLAEAAGWRTVFLGPQFPWRK
jgi:hypothetical protein